MSPVTKQGFIVWTIIIILLASAFSAFAETYFDKNCNKYEPTSQEMAALKIAKEVCDKEGWQWVDVGISDFGNFWQISTKCFQDGGNAVIDIDKKAGKVISKIFNKK